MLDGRPTPEAGDLHRMAVPVLRHRIIPNYNALGEGIETGAIVKHLLETVREPSAGVIPRKVVATLQHRYLDLAAMEALRSVRLRPRGAAEGTFAGPHKSHFRGTAVEFADYREYSPGDDIRLVDWKVFARTDRHYLRLYDAERNLLTYLVVDKSGSMEFSGAVTRTPSKLEYAARLAAALGYLVLREGDELGLSLVDARLHSICPRRPHGRNSIACWTRLAAPAPKGAPTLARASNRFSPRRNDAASLP